MKNLPIIVIALLSALPAKTAESFCFSFDVELSIELANGEIIKGYQSIYAFPYYVKRIDSRGDSASKFAYVREALLKNNHVYDTVYPDSITYYTARFNYEFTSLTYDEGEKYLTCQLISPISIPRSSIKNLRIEKIGGGGDYRILNAMKMSDTAWTKNKPLKQFFFYIDRCGFEVFVHDGDRRVRKTIRQLKAKQRKYKRETGELRYDEIDPEIYTIISRLNDHKVVVIQGCYQD